MARRTIIALVCVLCFGAAGVEIYRLQDYQIGKLQWARPYRDTLALPQILDRDRPGADPAEEELPQLAEVMALGYDNMVASILWLRVIQAFGARLQHIRENPLELRAIENLFLIITELDPHFIDAYKFGNFVLGDEGGDQAAALRLLDRGIVKNYKRTYTLPYEAVFICLNKLQNYKLALYYVRLALRARDCPEFVKRIENYIAAKRGNYEIALERWVRDDLEAVAKRQQQVLSVSRMQINNIVNQWHASNEKHTAIIETAMQRYFDLHQDYPARLEQLEEENLIGNVRQADGPKLMKLLNGCEEAGILVNTAVDIIMGTKDRPGSIIESNRVPRDLYGDPYVLIEEETIPVQKKPTVAQRRMVVRDVENQLLAIRRRIETYQKANGRYPAALADLPEMQPGSRERLPETDPTGMPWKYDPTTGKVSCYMFPEL